MIEAKVQEIARDVLPKWLEDKSRELEAFMDEKIE